MKLKLDRYPTELSRAFGNAERKFRNHPLKASHATCSAHARGRQMEKVTLQMGSAQAAICLASVLLTKIIMKTFAGW